MVGLAAVIHITAEGWKAASERLTETKVIAIWRGKKQKQKQTTHTHKNITQKKKKKLFQKCFITPSCVNLGLRADITVSCTYIAYYGMDMLSFGTSI